MCGACVVTCGACVLQVANGELDIKAAIAASNKARAAKAEEEKAAKAKAKAKAMEDAAAKIAESKALHKDDLVCLGGFFIFFLFRCTTPG